MRRPPAARDRAAGGRGRRARDIARDARHPVSGTTKRLTRIARSRLIRRTLHAHRYVAPVRKR
ncbi:hypothetical protein WL93_15495 [Burkholderia diffusa]|nr:hypothetical protein WL93_15495 [Burkholderia diffusa]